ncbi:uncharacterized protein LY79DRAFT_692989 [Colletotrichum navitas]|uniref:Uncharacterized protein n=1 Tax=Colletotrichum navitas TaxID=681940 RepID=A0AAD8Q964_9PEZI|nr:uncharacterized protein LY79DRAFT_692989 [Colletotrichum navitas]KAK1597924.1 hypothetical protein LY79DRAFT_692989 [Colletotrichum navitas]
MGPAVGLLSLGPVVVVRSRGGHSCFNFPATSPDVGDNFTVQQPIIRAGHISGRINCADRLQSQRHPSATFSLAYPSISQASHALHVASCISLSLPAQQLPAGVRGTSMCQKQKLAEALATPRTIQSRSANKSADKDVILGELKGERNPTFGRALACPAKLTCLLLSYSFTKLPNGVPAYPN